MQNNYRPIYDKGMYTSYGGSDIVASITFPGYKPFVFGELQTISYSVHREKFPVRTLGRINPKGFTMGGRTIAGSLIFTVFDRHAILQAMDQYRFSGTDESLKYFDHVYGAVSTDELPPFNVNISFNNEYGNASEMCIYGITIVDEGQVMSIEDILTENTMSYMARDIKLLEPVAGNRVIFDPNNR